MAVQSPRRRRRDNKASKVERYLPLGYFAVAALAAIVILPSALRPPAQQPNQTAELSPNAPPDNKQSAIISSLQRASSGVAAEAPTGPGTASTPAPTTPTTAPPVPATVLTPRACPHGVGNPPRQIESLYSAPCAAPFSGSNGGATSKGVAADEIRIGVRGPHYIGDGGGDCDKNGRVDDLIAQGDTTPSVRTYFVFEKYFNDSMQL